MNQRQRARMLAEETARFIDANFGQLDLRGSPSLSTPVNEPFAQHDKFGFNNVDVRPLSGATGLRKFISDPDIATLEEIADQTGDPNLVNAVIEQREEREAKAFVAAHPDYFKTDYNYEAIQNWLSARDLAFTRGNVTRAYRALLGAGELEVAPGTPRPLSEHDQRAIALQAASGDVEGAVTRYLMKRLPEDVAEMWQYATSHQEALDDVARPEFAQIIEEAVFYCWENGRANFMPTPERRRFLREYVAGRIPNARLLDEGWKACQVEERDALRSGLLNQFRSEQPATPAQDDIENLDDDAVRDLYQRTRRHVARDANRRPAGILQ
jgi:hypothetical protein